MTLTVLMCVTRSPNVCDIEVPSYSVKKSKEILNGHVYFGTPTSSIRTLNFFVYVRPFSRITSFCWFHLKYY
jgi:hypothetical protein